MTDDRTCQWGLPESRGAGGLFAGGGLQMADVDKVREAIARPGDFVYNNAAMVDGRFTEVTDSCGTGAEYASPGLPACVVAAPQGDDQRRFYRGNSMAGTFRPGDYLILEPVPIVAICPGDVVIYQGRDQEGEPDDVVHRVVGVVPGGLAARGDNNPTVDNILVTADNLLGRVRHFERDGKVYPVCGGRRGRLVVWVRHAWVHVRRYGDRVVRFLGRWPYRGCGAVAWCPDCGSRPLPASC